MLLVFVTACVVYLLVSIHLFWTLTQKRPIHKGLSLSLLAVGLLAHAALLYPKLFSDAGLNFNVFNVISLTSLFFLMFYVLFCLFRPILGLGIIAVPTAVLGLVAGYFGHAPYQPMRRISLGLDLHILLSIAAYCVLWMATIQAIILRLQIRELKHCSVNRLWVSKLPSLQSMESLLFDMILLGFVLLSLALGFGAFYVNDIIAQHVAHKAAFSVLSWLMFGVLLIGHWRAGWRGKRAATITIYGFILLVVGFVGSKVVLELIL